MQTQLGEQGDTQQIDITLAVAGLGPHSATLFVYIKGKEGELFGVGAGCHAQFLVAS